MIQQYLVLGLIPRLSPLFVLQATESWAGPGIKALCGYNSLIPKFGVWARDCVESSDTKARTKIVLVQHHTWARTGSGVAKTKVGKLLKVVDIQLLFAEIAKTFQAHAVLAW